MDLREALSVIQGSVPLEGKCDLALVRRVQAEQARIASTPSPPAIKPASVPKGLDAPPIKVRPIEALLRLARATTPLIPEDVHDLYQHWGWLRYLGAFQRDPHSGVLQLSDAAARVSGNQRRVLSEELGVGFGILLAEHWCRALGATGLITASDVDLVLRDGYEPLTQVRGQRRQPDYLLQFPDPVDSSLTVYKFLECKGTGSPAYAVDQLARATTQLASMAVGGNVPQGVAISTVSTAAEVAFVAVDPEGGEDRWPNSEVGLEAARQPKARPRYVEGVMDVEPSGFLRMSDVMSMGSLADYAGDTATAQRWLPESTSKRLARREKKRMTRETEFGDFVGQELVHPAPGISGGLRVFQGVESGIDAALKKLSFEEVRRAQNEFATKRRVQSGGDSDIQDTDTDPEREARATSPEGAYLSLLIVDQ